jgi:hypothetical protein
MLEVVHWNLSQILRIKQGTQNTELLTGKKIAKTVDPFCKHLIQVLYQLSVISKQC